MTTVKFVYWQADGTWIGYLQAYPDYWTSRTRVRPVFLADLKDRRIETRASLNRGPLGQHIIRMLSNPQANHGNGSEFFPRCDGTVRVAGTPSARLRGLEGSG